MYSDQLGGYQLAGYQLAGYPLTASMLARSGPFTIDLSTSGPALLQQQRFRGMGTALCLVTPTHVQCNKFRMIFVLC